MNILFFLPCFGGHFTAMINVLLSVSKHHNTTLVITSEKCLQKLESIGRLDSINFIDMKVIPSDLNFDGKIDFMWNFPQFWSELNRLSYTHLSKFLATNRQSYDMLITDVIFDGTLIAAEEHNMPVIDIITPLPGGVENLQDQMGSPLSDTILLKLSFHQAFCWLYDTRKELGLPELDHQGRFSRMEYFSRFPMLIVTSPMFYPAPHPSTKFLFTGSLRRLEAYQGIDPGIESWISESDKKIVYLSLGTHTVLDAKAMETFVKKVKLQENFRVIWSLGHGLQAVFAHLHLKSDFTILFTKYLSQYKLLGLKKVNIFVTHGGMGSLLDTIKQKKPIVLVPQFDDQFFNSGRMVSLGCGIQAPQFGFDEIYNSVMEIKQNYTKFKRALKRLEANFSYYEDETRLNEFVTEIASKGQVQVIQQLEFKINSQRFVYIWNVIQLIILLLFILQFARTTMSQKMLMRGLFRFR